MTDEQARDPGRRALAVGGEPEMVTMHMEGVNFATVRVEFHCPWCCRWVPVEKQGEHAHEGEERPVVHWSMTAEVAPATERRTG